MLSLASMSTRNNLSGLKNKTYKMTTNSKKNWERALLGKYTDALIKKLTKYVLPKY